MKNSKQLFLITLLTATISLLASYGRAYADAPSITSRPVTDATVGVLYEYPVEVLNPSGNQLTYTLDLPAGMTAEFIEGVLILRWVPIISDVGTRGVSIRVEDNVTAEFVTQSFNLSVISIDPECPATSGSDTDRDGIMNACDNCASASNSRQKDADRDGV